MLMCCKIAIRLMTPETRVCVSMLDYTDIEKDNRLNAEALFDASFTFTFSGHIRRNASGLRSF